MAKPSFNLGLAITGFESRFWVETGFKLGLSKMKPELSVSKQVTRLVQSASIDNQRLQEPKVASLVFAKS